MTSDRRVSAAHVCSDFKRVKPPVDYLFVRGRLPDSVSPRVTVVGTRTASRHAQRAAFTLARDLARAGVVVVSGMARGVDAAAHEGALEGGGVTVAFLGSGLDRISAQWAVRLAEKIQRRGALISEYPAETPAQRFTFVARNRLMAAYAAGTVVVEAGERSGALITADFALQLHKTVWAVPGDALRPGARGSNALLRDGALAVVEPADVLIMLGITGGSEGGFEEARLAGLSDSQARILKALLREGCLPVEDLQGLTGLPVPDLLREVSQLELAGRVVRTRQGLEPSKSF